VEAPSTGLVLWRTNVTDRVGFALLDPRRREAWSVSHITDRPFRRTYHWLRVGPLVVSW